MPTDSFQPETGGKSPEEEIRELEAKLEEKKRELASSPEAPPEEKEILRGVLREHVERLRSSTPQPSAQQSDQTGQTASGAADDQQKRADDAAKHERYQEQVRALVELALKKTIEDAVAAAEKQTPYLLDEFHDHLVDDYYDKMISLRKIKPL